MRYISITMPNFRHLLKFRLPLSLLLLFLLPSLPCALPAPTPWTPVPGPPGGVNPNAVAAGRFAQVRSGPQVFRSLDRARTWHRLDSLDPSNGIHTVRRLGDSLIGVTPLGSLVSEDSGETWKPWPPSRLGPGMRGLRAVADVGRVRIAHDSAGLFRSRDGGMTWLGLPGVRDRVPVWLPPEKSGMRELAAGPDGSVYLVDEPGVYRSTDLGESFHLALKGVVESFAIDGGRLWALSEGRLRRSDNGGKDWIPVTVAGADGKGFKAFVCEGKALYLADASGEFGSVDGGQKWRRIHTRAWGQGMAELAAGDGFWLARLEKGWLLRSEDQGRSWGFADVGNGNSLVESFIVIDSCLFAGTNSIGLFRSCDASGHWTPMWAGDEALRTGSLVKYGSDLVLGSPYGMWQSGNLGETWRPMRNGWNRYGNPAFSVDGERLYLGADDGLFRAVGRGDSLAFKDTVLQAGKFGLGHRFLYGVAARGSDIVVTSTNSSLSHSTDGGKTWDGVPGFFNELYAYPIWGMGNWVFAASPVGLYRGDWKAKRWRVVLKVENRNYPYYGVASLTRNGDALLAGALQGRIYASTNEGKDWKRLEPDLPDDHVRGLAVLGTTLYAWQPEKGIWRRELRER